MTIVDVLGDVVWDVVVPVVHVPAEPPTNYYPNSDLSGGYPPTSHALVFNDITGRLNDNLDGTFNFESHFDDLVGRNVLQWTLSRAVLELGRRYRLSYQVEKVDVGNYGAALNINNEVNIVIHDSYGIAVGQTTVEVFAEFTPSLGYEANIRIGCGTTSINQAHLIYSEPKILEVDLGSRYYVL